MAEGVGISKRQPYGGRPHQSHCTCNNKLAEVQAENERLRAVVEAARGWVASEHAPLQDAECSARELYAAVRAYEHSQALAALDGAGGTSSK